MTLYEINEQYRAFLAAVEDGEIPEDAVADTLEAIEADFDEKADNLACLIKELLAEADGIKKEADNLTARYKAKKNRVEWLKKILFYNMQAMGRQRLETARNRLAIKKTPAAVCVEDEEALIRYLLDAGMDDCVKQEASLRKTELGARLKAGEDIPGARMVAGERLEIK